MAIPEDVLGYQYDLACNGYELVVGRHPEPQARDHVQGVRDCRVTAKTRCAEPLWRHGQRVPVWRAAPRWLCRWDRPDRDVAGRCDANLRDVILFPMNQRAEDVMMGAPSLPTNEQMRELHLRAIPPTKG